SNFLLLSEEPMSKMRICFLSLACLALLGCNQQQNPDALKEKTAQATAELKSDAKAVASGVKEGWNRDKRLDLNTASKEDLMMLPGMTDSWADSITGSRPYDAPGDLVTRRIIPATEYEKISDKVTTKPSGKS